MTLRKTASDVNNSPEGWNPPAGCICRRLKDRRGETIVETLIAIMIASLSMALLVSMISTATKITGQSSASLQEYYTQDTLVSGRDSSCKAGTGNISMKDDSAVGSTYVTIGGGNRQVTYYRNDKAARTQVVSYEIIDSGD